MTSKFIVRRMLIALEPSPSAPAALGSALRLAARLQAEADSLFVEDARLFALFHDGDLPTTHVSALTGRPHVVDAAAMEAGLRAQGAQLAHAVNQMATTQRYACVLRTLRGPVAKTLIAEAASADLLVVSRRARHVGAVLAATARGAPVSVLVLPSDPGPAQGRIVIAASDGATLSRALAAAAGMAEARTVDLWLDQRMDADAAVAEARTAGLTARVHPSIPADAADFAARLPADTSLVILAADAPVLAGDGFRAFFEIAQTAALLLR